MGLRGQQHRPLARISLSSSHHRQSPSSSASRAVKINTHIRDWRFSRPEFTHTHISYSGVLLRCNNKRDPHWLWQPSAPPRGALVFMSAWVHIGEWAIRSECVRVGCSQHHSLGVMQNNAYIKQMNKHRKKTHLSQQYTMWKHEQHTNKLSIWIYRTEVIIFPYHGTRRIWVWARNAFLGPGAPTDGPWRHCASDYSPVHPKAIEIERQSVRLSHSILLYRHCWKHSIQTNDWIWQSRSRTQIKHHANKQTEGVNKDKWKQQ